MAEAMEKQMKLFEDDNVSSAKDKASKKLDTGLKELRGDRKETFDKMTEMLISGKVNDMSLKEKENFVTLYKMLKQHHGFSEGGLEQDGGTVDPVSGNEVPMGSSQEEVRDDIPAQLSEGEFVFPADVVRFIGLSKLMKLRQQAKAGLKRMEDMGQMGNSEEAILPDDIPFDMDDLNLEDDTLELQEGGMAGALVQGAARTFGGRNYADNINVQQGQTFGSQDFSIPPIGTQPIQPTPTDDYVSPIQAPTPVEAPVDPLPPFNVFVPPVADEYREYVNDEGIVINVPFFRGNILPGYTVPKGFRPKETEPVDTIADDVVQDIAEPEQDDRESIIKKEEEDRKNREQSYSNTVQKVMDENPNFTFQEVMDYIKDGNSTINIFGKEVKAPGFLFNEKDLEDAYNRNLDAYGDDFGESYAQLKPDEEERGYTFGDEADKRRAEAAAKKAAQEKAEAEAAAYQKSRLIAKQKAEEEFARIVAEEEKEKARKKAEEEKEKAKKKAEEEKEKARKKAEEEKEKARVQKMLEEADKEKARRQAVAEEAKARASQAEKERIARENAKRDAEAKAKRMAEAAERRRRQREEEKEKNKADREKNRNKSKKSSCFSPMSEFKMADGTIKQIKDIKIGDVVELGGKVSMVMQGDGLTAKWYTYGSTKVTSTHAVYENNNWTRVGTAKQSVLIDTVEPTLITLVNENHRLVAKDGVIFTDYDEVDNTGIEDDLLLELNKS
jgi:hypothetical protein